MKKALIIVDIQNDFLPGGALAVNEGDQIIPLVNSIQNQFDLIVATQDWHPANHGSFAANHQEKTPGEVIDLYGLTQVLWPVHCVQNSPGAEFASDLDMKEVAKIFHKGTDPNIDSYSGFFDNGRKKKTGLGDFLQSEGVTHVYVVGLATDYCVKYTALDAASLGFQTTVIKDACRGVNLQRNDTEDALSEMAAKGIKIITVSSQKSPQ
ncbi:MAG: bifunctional nicotinamidase/pyrazinamidase [Bacteroidetes bacterium]|nr:bifunctional nicotinamidase/pyrazinamidase [Bacteroidota bacterium]